MTPTTQGAANASATLAVSRRLNAAPEAVAAAWLDAESAALWLFATPGGVMERVRIEPRVGGSFEVFERRGAQLATHFGVYIEIDLPRRLVFDFSTERETAPTRVTVVFEPSGAGCLVTLTHVLDPRWAEYKERIEAGWAGILIGLERSLMGHDSKEMRS